MILAWKRTPPREGCFSLRSVFSQIHSLLSGLFLYVMSKKSPKLFCHHLTKRITYSVTIVTSVPWDTERVLRLVKTHMGKCLFSPELKSYLITQWNCTTIGSCRCRKRTNGSAAELHEPMATIRANIPAETGGASGYISGRFAIGSSGLLRLKRRLSRAATWHGKVRSTRSVSQGTEVTIVTEYVPYRYSTRTASCKDAYGNWI